MREKLTEFTGVRIGHGTAVIMQLLLKGVAPKIITIASSMFETHRSRRSWQEAGSERKSSPVGHLSDKTEIMITFITVISRSS